MDKKLVRALHGPSLAEVVIGAVLSLIAGVALAAVWLVFKPVVTVPELPAEPLPSVVYYVPGSANSTKGRPWLRKRQVLVEAGKGELTLNEDELNAWAAATIKPPEPAAGGTAPGAINFRVRDGHLQIGLPTTLDALGFARPVIVQTRGAFVAEGEEIAFAPEELYLGSLPTHRVPGLMNLVLNEFKRRHPFPEEVVAAWKSLSSITIADGELKIVVQ